MRQNLRHAFLRPVLRVLLLGLLVVCLKVTVAGWRGESAPTEDGNWLWLVLFPILPIVWWRYFPVFGCSQPSCLLADDQHERRNH